MEKYIASYDIGTSGVKIALLDLNGNVKEIATASYPLITPAPGWAEQDPLDHWNAVCSVTKEAVKKAGIKPENVISVVFNTQWKGIIPIDKEGNVLHNAIIWLDGRGGKQAEIMNQRLGKPGFLCERDYWPRLMWVKEERPDIYEKTETFLEVNSFLRYKATGCKSVDLTNDFIHSYDGDIQKLYTEIVEAAELDPDKFPPMALPTDKTGELTKEGAEALGLCEGTPVFAGSGDIPAIAIGSGCAGFGKGHIYLGSSGWLCFVYPERRNEIGELTLSLYVGKEMSLYAQQSIGMSLNWAIDQFYHVEKEQLSGKIYDLINREVEQTEPGCRGLIATPWVYGERPPLSGNAGCVYFNARNWHDRRYMMRAMMEAVCYSLNWKMELYEKQTGEKPESIRCVGGGALSDPWMQAMADIMNISVEVPKNPQHAGAVGGAYCALIGLGLVKDFSEADEKIFPDRVFRPRPEYREMYRKQFEAFKQIFPRMSDLFDELAQNA